MHDRIRYLSIIAPVFQAKRNMKIKIIIAITLCVLTVHPRNSALSQDEKAKEVWRLGPEDFALFRHVYRKNNGKVSIRNGYHIPNRFIHARPAPINGVFGWEVSGKYGYFQTWEMHFLPFSVGTSLSGEEVKIGERRARYVYGNLVGYGLVELRGKWKTYNIEKNKVYQKGLFKFRKPKKDVRFGKRIFRKTRGGRPVDGLVLEIERTYDSSKGIVEEILARIHGGNVRLSRKRKGRPVYMVENKYVFSKIIKYRYKNFQDDVDKAIAGGINQLRWELTLRGRFRPSSRQKKRDYEPGYIALSLLTLVKAEVDKKDALIRKCMDYLRSNPVLNTYSLGISLMAFEAYYAPPGEREELISGAIDKPYLRKVPEKDLQLMQEWAKRLCDYVDPRVDSAYEARWRYVGERSYDNSNTQYAVLGLHSANLCGIRISPKYLMGAASHYIRGQDTWGQAWKLPEILTYQDLERIKRNDRNYARNTVKTLAKGFSYREPDHTSGSMTTAGLAALTIAISDTNSRRWNIRGKIRNSLNMAYAWLHMNFSVRENPGRGFRWHYYYLYGLERAMELASIARLGDRDWYWEGAIYLLSARKGRRKGWPGITNDCFAVLFLKKAQTPVITGTWKKK